MSRSSGRGGNGDRGRGGRGRDRGRGQGGDRYQGNNRGRGQGGRGRSGGDRYQGNISGQGPRNEERRFFDALTKHDDSEIRSVEEARRLMRSALAFAVSDGGPELLYRLSESAGVSALRKSLEFLDADSSLFEDGLLPLLERLAQEDLNKPVYEIPMNSLFSKLYQLRFLLPSIRAILPNCINDGNKKRTALSWFVAKLALENEAARNDEDVIAIAKVLDDAGCGRHLQTIIGGNKVKVSLLEIRDAQLESAGGRHDNDKEDFRSITIVPTCQEFLCDADPYLPLPIEDGSATEAFILDRHFRLLREDLIGPSKEAKDDPKKQQRDIFYGVRPVKVETGTPVYLEDKNGLSTIRVTGETDPCILFQVQLPAWFRINSMKSLKDKEAYWEKNRRILPRDALICLERKNEKNDWVPVRFGTIVRREASDLIAHPPLIGISFSSKEDIEGALIELSDSSIPPTRLVVVSADLFAYQPILNGLQMMTEVPFKHEIVDAKQSLPAGDAPIAIPGSMEHRVNSLDNGQRNALNTAMNDRVALVQGPPGTGKSFIGVLLAELFLATTDHIILVVTYTNHALDDFLESLLNNGVTKIVRMGGRSSSSRLSEYNLRELSSNGRARFSREHTRRYAQLKQSIEEAEKDVKRLVPIISKEIGEKWWRTVEPFLQVNHREYWEQLSVPDDVIKDQDGFQTAGVSGKDHLWKCWLKNKEPPLILRRRAVGRLWEMSLKDRRAQKLKWQHEIHAAEREEISLLMKAIKTARDELKSLQQISDSVVLSQARVIGCTTTKAAMCKSLLSGVGAGILLVEEAAEIREADVLTSLSPSTKRLIMIGDHKQLRPKCQHYPLTVESNCGLDLNRSLFERLAMSPGFRLATLGVQHRMHPDISSIIRLVTYNDLADAPTVSSHFEPLGLCSRVIFVNHNSHEDEQHVDALESVSKTNSHERAMIVKTVEYLLKQGYLTNDIVVLTPYLGQMMKLHAEIGKCVGVSMDERDLMEAREQFRGSDEFSKDLAAAKQRSDKLNIKSAIRVATIDNYQGEEAKIILVSLVRSNEMGQIGFLKEPERVNVMLSRARECEIIFGNRSTLELAKGSLTPLKGGFLWKKIFAHLESCGHIFDGLPVVCQNHRSRALLICPNDFDFYCRNGGCSKRCVKEHADCGHPCQLFCHPGPCPKCPIICLDVCTRGHELKKKCSADLLPKCHRVITWSCPMGHVTSGLCYEGKFGRDCKICISIRDEEEACIRREAALTAVLDERRHRLAEVKCKLEEAKQSNTHRNELKCIENELSLAQKELDRFLDESLNNNSQASIDVTDTEGISSTAVMKNVLILLQKKNEVTLSNFLSTYRNEFNLTFDAKRLPRRKLVEILQSMPFCEITPNKKSVRLRDGYIDEAEPLLKAMNLDSIPVTPALRASYVPNSIRPPASTENNHPIEREELNSKDVEKNCVTLALRASNVLNSILPPAPSMRDHPIDSDEDIVAHVLRRYNAEGALKADDLLDEISTNSCSIDALRFLIEIDLNPDRQTSAPAYMPTKSNMINALLLTARSFDLRYKYPLQASDLAQQALSFIEDESIKSCYPTSWVADLESIHRLPLNPKQHAPSINKGSKTASETWLDVERDDPNAPKVMRDSILPMTGLEAVKESLLSMYRRFKLSQEQGDGAAASYNVRFEGNPGTGKTTIARHYGLFLQQLMVLPEGSVFQETNGAKLKQGGVKGCQEMLEEVKEKGGGAIFVDEAYQLASDSEGEKVLDFILPLAESLDTEYGCLVWVFAGYKKPLEKLFEYNDGLPSRFPFRFIFEDYTDEELHKIFSDMMKFMPPLRSLKNNVQKIQKTPSSPHSPRSGSGYGYRNYPPRHGETKICRFGMQWKYIEYSGWTDKYGNRTVDPDVVGTKSSELVDEKGNTWVILDKSWSTDDGISQEHYPGSPVTLKSEKKNQRPTPFHCEEQHLEIAIKRLGRRRGERGFGNARAVRVLFETVRDRQAIRISKERFPCNDIFLLSKADLLGPEITAESLKKSKAWTELQKLEGIIPVKESVEQLFKLVLRNVEREKRGEEPLGVSLNRLFLGNPGTGKTTVASLYGRILTDLQLLSKGEVILKCASDFVGEVLGSSEQVTQGILKSAEGCVLVIDEAYSLYSGGSTGSGTNDPYKTAVIDTIVEKVQAKPGADIAVVMIGYQEEMENMMSNVNPGLSRRFQIDEAFHFPDFDDSALVRIMLASAMKRGVTLTLTVAKRAVRTLARSRAKPHFGNAGAIDNLLSKGIVRMQGRCQQDDTLTEQDFEYVGDGPDLVTLDLLFDDLIGCKSVKEKMAELKSTVEFSQAQGKAATACGISFNYLFLGNPGTGKTTCARKMGRMFNALGLLPGDNLIEAKASDLVTGYAGQAGKCTREILRKSLGGVLFIDEAYQMDPARGGPYMTEAVDAMVGALTEEEFKGKLLVVLAGYSDDMEKMLKTNPGLKSRFSERVMFEDFDAQSVTELLVAELKKSGVPLQHKNSEMDALLKLSNRLINGSGSSFGNGRDCVTWSNEVYKIVAKRFSRQPKRSNGGPITFNSTLDDIENALDQFLVSSRVRAGGQSCGKLSEQSKSLMATTQQRKDPPPLTKISYSMKMSENEEEEIKSEQKAEENIEEVVVPNNIFDGFDSNVLNTLQAVIDELGVGSEEGASQLKNMNPNSKEFANLLIRLQKDTGMSYDAAKAKLTEWQSLQENLEEMIQKEKIKTKTLGARPIWRCGVCGRADKPWIACYVAPFIVRYEKIPLDG